MSTVLLIDFSSLKKTLRLINLTSCCSLQEIPQCLRLPRLKLFAKVVWDVISVALKNGEFSCPLFSLCLILSSLELCLERLKCFGGFRTSQLHLIYKFFLFFVTQTGSINEAFDSLLQVGTKIANHDLLKVGLGACILPEIFIDYMSHSDDALGKLDVLLHLRRVCFCLKRGTVTSDLL